MADHEHADPTHHIVQKSTYYLIFLALMVGTGLTWWVATIDLGAMNNVIMLTIAVTKATLVVLFFMHVKYSSRLTWLVVAGALLWLALLLATVTDYFAPSMSGAPAPSVQRE